MTLRFVTPGVVLGLALAIGACATTTARTPSGERPDPTGSEDVEIRRSLAGMPHGAWKSTHRGRRGDRGRRPGGAEAWMVADRLAAADVAVILKPLTSTPEEFERLGARFDNAARLHAAGVRIAFTTFGNHRANEIAQEAGNAVRFGLSWDAALEAITRTPAEIYGVADEYGSIETGRVANLVVWSGDPLELSSHPTAVVIRGHPVPEWSRQRELLERYRTIDDARRAYRPEGPR